MRDYRFRQASCLVILVALAIFWLIVGLGIKTVVDHLTSSNSKDLSS